MGQTSLPLSPVRTAATSFTTSTWPSTQGNGLQWSGWSGPDADQCGGHRRVPALELPMLGHGHADCRADRRQAGRYGLPSLCKGVDGSLWTTRIGGGRSGPRVRWQWLHRPAWSSWSTSSLYQRQIPLGERPYRKGWWDPEIPVRDHSAWDWSHNWWGGEGSNLWGHCSSQPLLQPLWIHPISKGIWNFASDAGLTTFGRCHRQAAHPGCRWWLNEACMEDSGGGNQSLAAMAGRRVREEGSFYPDADGRQQVLWRWGARLHLEECPRLQRLDWSWNYRCPEGWHRVGKHAWLLDQGLQGPDSQGHLWGKSWSWTGSTTICSDVGRLGIQCGEVLQRCWRRRSSRRHREWRGRRILTFAGTRGGRAVSWWRLTLRGRAIDPPAYPWRAWCSHGGGSTANGWRDHGQPVRTEHGWTCSDSNPHWGHLTSSQSKHQSNPSRSTTEWRASWRRFWWYFGFWPDSRWTSSGNTCNALSESTSRTSFVAKAYTQPLFRSVFRSGNIYTTVDFGSPNWKVHHESTDHFQIQRQWSRSSLQLQRQVHVPDQDQGQDIAWAGGVQEAVGETQEHLPTSQSQGSQTWRSRSSFFENIPTTCWPRAMWTAGSLQMLLEFYLKNMVMKVSSQRTTVG